MAKYKYESYFKHDGVYEKLSALTGIPIDILKILILPLNLSASSKESDFIIWQAKMHRLAKHNKTRRLFK